MIIKLMGIKIYIVLYLAFFLKYEHIFILLNRPVENFLKTITFHFTDPA